MEELPSTSEFVVNDNADKKQNLIERIMEDFPTSSNLLMDDNAVEEPSPIDKRLTEGRSFNDGNWTSHELKLFFDGILKYGTSNRALNYIAQNFVVTRTNAEIKVKLFEIRDMAGENKEECREYYKNIWIQKGYHNIVSNPDQIVNENLTWLRAIELIQASHHFTFVKYENDPIRSSIKESFRPLDEHSLLENSTVTDSSVARAKKGETKQTIRWDQIYQFIEGCANIEETLPVLNELEAAIVLNVLDSIEDEAGMMPDEDKAIYRGLFTEVELNDIRAFEPDYPPTIDNATHLRVDPLRTRLFGVPEVAAEPTTLKSDELRKNVKSSNE